MRMIGRILKTVFRMVGLILEFLLVGLGAASGGGGGGVKNPARARDLNSYANLNLKKDEYRP